MKIYVNLNEKQKLKIFLKLFIPYFDKEKDSKKFQLSSKLHQFLWKEIAILKFDVKKIARK